MRLTPLARAALACVCVSSAAFAQEAACLSRSEVSLERRLRQLSLDLLGRPPTMEEYRFVQNKGGILEEDIIALTGREAFYNRLKDYHRALLRSNVSSSVSNDENNTLLSPDSTFSKALDIRGVPANALRGHNGVGCNTYVLQDSCNDSVEDPHLEPAVKTCRDSKGVPLPVSVDYDSDNYACYALTIPSGVGCDGAINGGSYKLPGAAADGGSLTVMLDPKYYYFCDGRRSALTDGGASMSYVYCTPNSALVAQGLTQEVLDTDGKVIAYVNPAPPSGAISRLDRCSLDLVNSGGVTGNYAVQNGCIQREGYVTNAQAPYWDELNTASHTPVKMCAIEAQANDVNPWTGASCETRLTSDRTCGCGVAARRCEGAGNFKARVLSVNEEPLRIADSVVRRDENYFSILTTRRGFVNGPLSQLYRNAQSPRVWMATPPVRADLVPNVPITEPDTWVEYTRDEYHSGVLTTAEWLYRFPTVRSRTSQFWQSFLCKSFVPPANAPVPSPEDSCNRENNLAQRCGCKGCHATMEPVGAHWGRFGERSAQYLDPMEFPKVSAKCRDCALANNVSCDGACANYVMQAYDGDGAASLGLLKTYLYRTPDEEPNITGGPKALVEKLLQTGDLERCAVQNMWNQLLGRPMTDAEAALYLQPLVDDFAQSGHNLRKLMVRIVSTDAYWRVD